MEKDELLARLDEILLRDERYKIDAYLFVISSLEFTMNNLGRHGHVTGRELLDGIRLLARREFGPMARPVLESWGVVCTDDFGQIVFSLVDAGLFGKTDEDSVADFHAVYDFGEVFEKQYDWSVDGAGW